MFKNVASQKLTVFCFDATTNLPKTGDAANLTAYVDKDDGGVTVLADTSATEKDATNAKGYYIFDLTQGETNADKLLFSCKSATSNIVVVCVPAVVYTIPASWVVPANVTQLLGTAWLTPAVAGTPDVNAKQLGGTAQTGRDVGASVLLSAGTGTGQLDFTSGVVKANLVQILASAITGTAAQLVAAFTKFFNVSSPTGTINSIPDAVAGASGGLALVGSNVGAATSVSGAVGSVTAGVTVTTNNDKTGYGLAAGAITAAVVATDAIDDDALSADAVTAIQSGLATSANQTTILARIGSFTGSGVNTILGFLKALLSKTASTPSDVGGTFDPSTDSTEAIRDRGDAAWTTATGFATSSAMTTAQADLDDIQTRLPAALTSGGNMKSDALALDGSTTAATRLKDHVTGVLKVIVGSGSTTTSLVLNASTGINGSAPSSTNDLYNGRVLVFLTGSLAGEATDITDYVGSTVTLTVTALTGAPSSGDTAVLV